jgi:signal transduction histidine kinase/CheY-like chemotaxis protein/PAS domain-containing protein
MDVENATTERKKICHHLLFEHPWTAFALVRLVCGRDGLPQYLMLLDANSTWEKYGGVKKEHVGGKPIRTGPLSTPLALEQIAHTLQIGQPTLFELYSSALDRWFTVLCFALDSAANMAACIILDIAEQKTAHVLNVRPDERYRTLILACSEWIARLSSDGRILYPIRTPWPLPFTEKTGCSWLNEIIPCQDRATLINTLNRAITKKQPIKGTIRIYYPDGSLHWLHSRAVPIMAQSGEIDEWFVVADDITKRKQMEVALRDSEERLSYLLNLSDTLRPLDTPDAILTTVCKYLADYLKTASVCFCELNSDHNLINIHAFVQRQEAPNPPEYDSILRIPFFASRLGAGEIVAVSDVDALPGLSATEKELCKATGRRAFLSIPILVDTEIVATLSVSENTPRQWSSAEIALVKETAERTWDTLERAEIHLEVMQSRERQTYLLQLSDALRELEDPHEITKTALLMIKEHLGAEHSLKTIYTDETSYMMAEGGSDNTGLYLQGAYQASEYPACHEILCSGEMLVINDSLTTQRIPLDEARRLLSCNLRACVAAPIIHQNRLVATFSIALSTPRTWTSADTKLVQETAERTWMAVERAKAAAALRASENHALALVKKLEKADRNKDRYLSILSHELRNPLAAIMAGLSTLEGNHDRPQLNQVIASMTRQAEQLCKLVNDLLELTRITQNRLFFKKEQVNLNTLLMNTLTDIKPEFDAKQLRLLRSIGRRHIHIKADPVRITQCIENLLHNALKFTPSGGTVRVSLRQAENDAVLTIRDNGIGIHPDILPELFSPFIQADQSLDRHDNSGLGLGLYIVKSIIAQHNGRVTAHSAGLGQGATFILYLPVVHQTAPDITKSPSNAKMSQHRILLIDDNKDLVELLRSMFIMLGHEAYAANEGVTGIESAKRNHPDIIFCDIGLPGMSGYEIAQVIRQDPELKDIYLVALTGYAGQADVELAIKHQFDQHLAKPVDMIALQRILAELPRNTRHDT